ncbi:MAG: hypothetical protein DRP15_02675 [Candidatus Aenigmatarchaeota archaeon]|nr:MAG: hypothetical protein DRP15_02675 [Candidatus Aenigmarchaeota archaeon]
MKKNYMLYHSFLLVILLVVLFLFYKIISYFLIPLFLALFFVVVTYPLFCKLKKKTKSDIKSAVIMLVSFILVVLVPLSVFSFFLVSETSSFYTSYYTTYKSKISKDFCKNTENIILKKICSITEKDFIDKIINISGPLLANLIDVTRSVGNFLFQLFIFLFALFIFYRDGQKIKKYVLSLIPLETKYKNRISVEFAKTSKAVFLGIILTSIIQGAVAFIGFLLFGLPNPFLLGLLAIFLSLLPYLGSALIWLPAGLIYIFLSKDYFMGFGILFYGLFIISPTDNLVRPKLIGKKSNVPMFIVFLAVIGGVYTFGMSGVIIGPSIVVILKTLLDIYKLEFLKK